MTARTDECEVDHSCGCGPDWPEGSYAAISRGEKAVRALRDIAVMLNVPADSSTEDIQRTLETVIMRAMLGGWIRE